MSQAPSPRRSHHYTPVFLVLWPALYLYFRFIGHARTRVLLTYQGEVLLIQDGIPLLADRVCLGLPGGGINRREDPAAAAARELHEELGLTIDPSTLQLLGTQPTTHRRLCYQATFYHLELTEKPTLTLQQSEIADTEWLPITEVSQHPVQSAVHQGVALLSQA